MNKLKAWFYRIFKRVHKLEISESEWQGFINGTNNKLDGTTYTSSENTNYLPTVTVYTSPFCVEVLQAKNKEYCVRLKFKKNRKIFMHSETYKRKKYALDKAILLADSLNCQLKEIDGK